MRQGEAMCLLGAGSCVNYYIHMGHSQDRNTEGSDHNNSPVSTLKYQNTLKGAKLWSLWHLLSDLYYILAAN